MRPERFPGVNPPRGGEVLLDTNALLLPGQTHLDIFEALDDLGYTRRVVPGPVAREVSHLARSRGREGSAARVALGLLEHCEILPASPASAAKGADSALLALARERGAAVFTLDRNLKRRLLAQGTPVVHPRGERILDVASPAPRKPQTAGFSLLHPPDSPMAPRNPRPPGLQTPKAAADDLQRLARTLFQAPGKNPYILREFNNMAIANLEDLVKNLDKFNEQSAVWLANWVEYLGDPILAYRLRQTPARFRAVVEERYRQLQRASNR